MCKAQFELLDALHTEHAQVSPPSVALPGPPAGPQPAGDGLLHEDHHVLLQHRLERESSFKWKGYESS